MTTTTLRVRFTQEEDPTYPDSWGWSDEDTREYMEKLEHGDYVVLQAAVEHLCERCADWHDAGQYLGDIHVSWDDFYPAERNGALRTVTLDDIPQGPSWWGPTTPANAATSYTPAANYLLHVAADLIAEASHISV